MAKVRDQLISLLGWNLPGVRMPVIFALAAVPFLYMAIKRARTPAAPMAAASAPAAPAMTLPSALDPSPFREDSGESAGTEEGFSVAWDKMVGDLEKAARGYPSQVAIYVKDLKRDREWSYHADDLFPAASLIKVPVMAGIFEKIHRGELSLDAELSIRRSTRMGGSGSLKWQRDGTRLTVTKLLEKMILESDNTAQRMLIDEVGMEFLQRQFPKMGLVYTEIYPEGLSLSSNRVKYENYTTAREMSMIFEKIYKGDMVDKDSSAMMLDILKRRRVRSRLSKSLPIGWEIAHKTGLLRMACHDSSIIFSPEGDYVLTVLTGRNRNYSSAKDFITRVGRITYRQYKSDFGLYAKAENGSSAAVGR